MANDYRKIRSPFEALLLYLWAHYDPNTRHEHPDGPKGVLPPWITAVSVLNGTVACALEIMLIIGFFMMDAECL